MSKCNKKNRRKSHPALWRRLCRAGFLSVTGSIGLPGRSAEPDPLGLTIRVYPPYNNSIKIISRTGRNGGKPHMGKNRRRKHVIWIAVSVLFLCMLAIVTAVGCLREKSRVYMYTEPVPEEANDWACDSFQVLAEIAGDFPEEFGVLPSGGPLVLGQGFFGYRASGNSWEKRNTVYYPVLQNGKIILFLTSCYDGEGWFPSMSGEMAEIFRRKLLERSSQKDIGIICSAADGSTVPEAAVVFAKSENTWGSILRPGKDNA